MAKRGRPPLSPDGTTTAVNLKLPDRLYDSAYAAAREARCSVPEMIRRLLWKEFRNPKSTSHAISLTL